LECSGVDAYEERNGKSNWFCLPARECLLAIQAGLTIIKSLIVCIQSIVKYISTRGQAPSLNFEEVTLAGLARDGGLYVPESWPTFSAQEIREMRGLTYPELVVTVLRPFIGDCIDEQALQGMAKRAYANFSHTAIAPIKQLDTNLYFMELFQGPTLAFKDFALQFLGQLFEHFLAKRDEHCTIVGATSGDTGSAAIEAVRGIKGIELFMLHPNGRVSSVQRKQMTYVEDRNIHNIAIEGHFDDCQNLVKAMFNDSGFRDELNLSAVNSINWARIAAQVVYYFRAALSLGGPDRPINVSVPTGNFGNIFAAYVAKQMGLPIEQLIIGSNRNDILTRFFEGGIMEQKAVEASLSPSMDIQISSNFERYLFEASGRDAAEITRLMEQFKQQGTFSVNSALFEKLTQQFSTYRLDDEQTTAEIASLYRETGEIIDPHSVIGIAAARACSVDPSVPVVCMGTADPAKFADAVEPAIGAKVPYPARLEKVLNAKEHFDVLENDLDEVQGYIRLKVG
jgi:threonine synthase